MPSKTQSERGVVARATQRIFVAKLRVWFKRHGRDLPWRRSRDGYEVLVSELMLQQTQVSRVIDYYQRFLTRFPTLTDVARARPERVMEAWDGLGYYARARHLHRLATRLTDGGTRSATVPTDPKDLERLPGVGPYTAAAVASFAYERRATPIDTNVARVLRRAFAPRCNERTAQGKRRLRRIAEAILPRSGQSAWLHNQALMELGALICTARVAHCPACPVRTICASTGMGTKRRRQGFRSNDHG